MLLLPLYFALLALPQNFVNDEFHTEGPQSSDIEFNRRIHLDLTGRIPSPRQIREFIANPSPDKRDQLIDHLLQSTEFSDKWTMWMGDWLQNSTAGIYGGTTATRNQFYLWIRAGVREGRSLRAFATDVLLADQESATAQTGGFLASTEVNTGPKEDSWDNMFSKSATVFLGLSHYDCVLCHSGQGHLEPVSLWGSRTSRLEAQRMAAFFTHTFSYPGIDDEAAGLQFYATNGYRMDTDSGNRPNRIPSDGGDVLKPAYRDGSQPGGDPTKWRAFFTTKIVDDPMFARNIANRLWKQLFGLALAEPFDALDPARLDPANPPPSPWTLQASHPALLEKLAQSLRDSDFDLRAMIRLLARSAAYQMASPSHLPRRLDAEEVHDAVVTATGVANVYTIPNLPDPVRWAMQAPDASEPLDDHDTKDFLDAFYRGDRVGIPRSAASSLLQSLKLLSDPFVLSRLRVTASPVLQRIAAMDSPDGMVDELFLAFLSRYPSESEKWESLDAIQKAGSHQRAVEDLAWALVNRTDFLFCY